MHLVLLLVILNGCDDDSIDPLVACIEIEGTPEFGKPIQFRNCTPNADSYFWTFPDGTSTDPNPLYTLSKVAGNTVSLIVMDNAGNSDTESTVISFTESNLGALLNINEGETGVIPEDFYISNTNETTILSQFNLNGFSNIQISVINSEWATIIENNELISSAGVGDFPKSFVSVNNNGFAVNFFNHSPGAPSDIYKVAGFDTHGNLQWVNNPNFVFTEIIFHNNEIFVFGAKSDQLSVARLDINGQTIDTKSINFTASNLRVNGVVYDDGFIVGGSADFTGTESDVFIIKLTESLDLDWEQKVGESNGQDDILRTLRSSEEGIVAGGSIGNTAFMSQINTTGSVIETWNFDQETTMDVLMVSPGSILVALAKSNGLGDQAKVVNFNPQSGDSNWERYFSGQDNAGIVKMIKRGEVISMLLGIPTTNQGISISKIKIININENGEVVD